MGARSALLASGVILALSSCKPTTSDLAPEPASKKVPVDADAAPVRVGTEADPPPGFDAMDGPFAALADACRSCGPSTPVSIKPITTPHPFLAAATFMVTDDPFSHVIPAVRFADGWYLSKHGPKTGEGPVGMLHYERRKPRLLSVRIEPSASPVLRFEFEVTVGVEVSGWRSDGAATRPRPRRHR